MVEMIASMETYLRRGRRTCQRLLLNPKIRTGGVVLLCGGSGFLLSAASLGNYPQPLAMGLILAMSGWHAAVMSLGAMLGYWVFWGIAGLQGLVWSASGGLLALLLARHIPEEQPLIFPAISAFLTALTGLLFQLVLRDTVPVPVYFLRIVLAAGAGLLFPVALRRRTAVTDWLVGGVAVLAQVRLELGAEVLGVTQQLFLETAPPPVDASAVLQKVRQRACGSCSARNSCPQQSSLDISLLQNPLEAQCRKSGRLIPELRRGQEQLKLLKADSARQSEYRAAMVQQYQFLGDFLRGLADDLPRRGQRPRAWFRAEAAARSRSKELANGDRCLAFPGPECRYYVLLCDGMGTGLGAAQEGQSAGSLLRQMLTAGFPAAHALRTLNSILALRGSAGAVTVDLAELYLDTGHATLYKWGAAPSWLLRRGSAEKIGTATPPPGISVTESRETVEKLSLRRGEALVLLSDGVDGEGISRRSDLTPDMPPGELAAKILEYGRGKQMDDATAAVIRLRPTSLQS